MHQFNIDASLFESARAVKIVFLDVDGVLTDGTIYYGAQGESLKPFNTLDGQGLKYLIDEGLVVAIISGRGSEGLKARALDLGVQELHMNVSDKRRLAQDILNRHGLDWSQAAAMGDDWPDVPILNLVGLSSAPKTAHPELRSRVHWVSQENGGHGAVRELCDLILRAQGRYDTLLNGYLT